MSPEQLIKQLKQLNQPTIFFGPQSFELAQSIEQLHNMQQGFAIDTSGNNLTSEQPGHWQPSWVVIAKDGELGDPYFVDIISTSFAVHTAIFNEQTSRWQTETIASNFMAFISCLALLNKTSQQTQAQFVPDENTIADTNQLSELQQKLALLSESPQYWQYFFNCYDEWLNDDEF